MAIRTALTDFALQNPYYAGASCAVYEVDENLMRTSTLATLYAAPVGSTLRANPMVLDSDGRFPNNPIYVDKPVIVEVTPVASAAENLGVQGMISRWRGVWQTGTLYYPGERVRDPSGPTTYVVLAGHVSATFSVDVATGLLEEEIDAASIISDSTTATRSGTGAVPRTFDEYFATAIAHVADFGAVGDGLTDDTTAIQNAINHLDALGGGTLRFDAKNYRHTGLTLAGHNVRLQGAGNGWNTFAAYAKGTRLTYAGSSTGNWISVPGDQMAIEDMELVSAVALTGGVAVSWVRTGDAGSRHSLRRVNIRAPYNGLDNYGFSYCILEDVYIGEFTGDFGWRIRGDATYATIYSMAYNVTVDGAIGNDAAPGLLIQGNSASHTLHDCYFRNSAPGVEVREDSGYKPGVIKFFRCEAEANREEAYKIAGEFVYLTDCWISTSGLTANGGAHSGILIGSGCRGIISIRNCDIRGNGRHGIDVQASSARVQIEGCLIAANSQNTPNTYHGINFQAGCADFIVSNNMVGGDIYGDPNGATLKQRNGITITGGCADYIVSDNDVRGNLTNPIFDGGVGAVGVVKGNYGYVTEASGNEVGVSPNANGNVSIAHGLHAAPVYGNAMILGDSVGTGVEVQQLTTTNVVVRLFNEATGADVTAGTFNIMWHVRSARA